MSAEARLAELGITLPEAPTPAGSYVPVNRTGNLVFTAGQIPTTDGAISHRGVVGADVDLETANAAARVCTLNGLAAVRKALGSLDEIEKVVKVTGFVSSAPGFTDQPKVINGASDFLLEVFGDAGLHARSAVGVAGLPLGVCVEVEFIFQVK
ncbi:MAG: RidA family protein [Planctomycetota bacterium]